MKRRNKKNSRTVVTILVVLAVATGVAFLLYTRNTEAPVSDGGQTLPQEKTTTVLPTLALLTNAEISVPYSGQRVQLTDGSGLYAPIDGGELDGDVTLIDGVYTAWTEGGRADLAAVFAVHSGGSGTFYYLVLFDVTEDIVMKKSEMFLGNRIGIEGMYVGELVHDANADYRITVRTQVRAKGAPFSDIPTLTEVRTFYVTDQILKEIIVGSDDT